MKHPRILIIVPAYNESGNIQKTIESIKAENLSVSILVVDDGSRDATAKEARRAGALVAPLPFNLGIGGAVQTGFKFALQNHFDAAVQIDGDGQHDPKYLKDVLGPVLEGKADLVVGSRFLTHEGYGSSFVRRIGIRFFAWLISFLCGIKIADSTSGFRAYSRKLIKAFAEYYPHDFPEPEAIVVAKDLQAKILEVPVAMHKRGAGISSIRYLGTLYYMIKVTFAILLNKIKRKRKIT